VCTYAAWSGRRVTEGDGLRDRLQATLGAQRPGSARAAGVVSDAVAAAAAALWLLVGFKFVGTIRSGSAPARWLLATFAFLALGITIFIPAVEQRLTAAAPVEQIKEPLARSAVMAAAFCAQTLLSLTGPDQPGEATSAVGDLRSGAGGPMGHVSFWGRRPRARSSGRTRCTVSA